MATRHRGEAITPRHLLLALVLAETALWVVLVWNGFATTSDPATRGIDRDSALLGSQIYAVTGAPALALALWRRWLLLAATLALAPPLALIGAMAASV